MQKLSAEVFEEITRSLTSDRSLRIHEKREKPRVGLRSTVDVVACDKGRHCAATSVWIRDVSAEGLGLVSSTPLEKDFPFIAEFNRAGNQPLHVMYKVAYCKSLANGIFSIGARLVRVMPTANQMTKDKRRRPVRAV